ncbi:MAG: TIGR01620 family protein [Pontibacterium sp.]
MSEKKPKRQGRTLNNEQEAEPQATVNDFAANGRQGRSFVPDEPDQLKAVPEALCGESDAAVVAEFKGPELGFKPLKGLKWFLGLSLVYVLVLFAYTTYDLLLQALNFHWVVGGLFILILSFLLVSGLITLAAWLSDKDRLSGLKRLQHQAGHFREVQSYGHVKAYLKDLGGFYAGKPQASVFAEAVESLPDYADDKEAIAHLETHFVNQMDQAAYQQVSRFSVQTGLAVALSPWGAMDMLLTLWRNSKMIEEVSKIYGVRPGYANRLKILMAVLNNMAFAAVSQMVADHLAKVSASGLMPGALDKVSQGMGSALITVRIGILTINACRPVPYAEGQQPKLKDFTGPVTDKLIEVFSLNKNG